MVVANGATAQETQRIVVTPYAGVFIPSSSVAEVPLDIGGRLGLAGIEQQAGLATGITASYSFNNFAGIELSGAWAFSDVKVSPVLAARIPGFAERHESARVVIGAAKLMFNLLPINRRAALRLGVGPAIISRGGSAFKADDRGDFDGVTDVGGAISLCTRLPLSDFLAVRLRAENFMYASRLRYRDFSGSSETFTFDSQVQNDLIFSAGLQMVWWR